jgi:hypothetical protein
MGWAPLRLALHAQTLVPGSGDWHCLRPGTMIPPHGAVEQPGLWRSFVGHSGDDHGVAGFRHGRNPAILVGGTLGASCPYLKWLNCEISRIGKLAWDRPVLTKITVPIC